MFSKLKNLFNNKKGITTVEVILILSIIICVALIFRTSLLEWVNNAITKMFPSESIINNQTP